MTGDPTFATSCLRYYCKNMGFTIIFPLLTILKIVGQVEVSNKEIKQNLAKMVNASRTDLLRSLDDTLWDNRNVYKTPVGMSPYKLV